MLATLTARQVSSFSTDGYVVLPDLIRASEVERLREDAQALLAARLRGMLATLTPDPRVTWWRLESGQPYVLKVKPVTDLMPAAAALAADPRLTSMAAELLGGTPRLMEDKIMYKQVVDVAAGWANLPTLGEEVRKHTDAAYFAARGYRRVLTVAVCLDECSQAAGAPRVWPGTHRQPVTMVPTAHQGPVVPDEVAPDADAVTLTASFGTVLAWDAAVVHASGPNTTSRPRRLLVLGYTPTGGQP